MAPRKVRLLTVSVGEHGDCDVPLLEAVEHLAARCGEVTEHVIFHAASWNAFSGVAHREAFWHPGASLKPKLVGPEHVAPDPSHHYVLV